jgi:hypothetical protein
MADVESGEEIQEEETEAESVDSELDAEQELNERIEFYKNEQKKSSEQENGEEEEPPESEADEPPIETDQTSEEEKPQKPKKSFDERINELVFQREQEKRDKEKEIKEKILLQQEIDSLRQSIEEIKTAKTEAEKPKPSEELSTLMIERESAAKEMDFDKTAELDNQIFKALLKAAEDKAKASYSEMKQKETKTEIDNAIKNFHERNVWIQPGHEKFNADKAAFAEGLYVDMSRSYKGPVKEMLKEIESRVNKVFDSLNAKQKTPVSIVGKVDTMRTKQKQDDQLPTLTAEQKAFAHRTYQDKSKKEAEQIYARNVKKYAKSGRY